MHMKILIVDDNREMRGLIRTIIGEGASEFVECADGQEAVTTYESERPDWTVMDVAMGAMDGLTATRLIKAKHPEARIMVVTQHQNPALRERAQQAGATGFLLKEDLLELRSAFERTATTSTEPPSTET